MAEDRKPTPPPVMLASAASAVPAPATSAQLVDVLREVRACRRVLDEHIQHAKDEREANARRHDAIMEMLRELLSR